jgi:LPS sulfotransferase NodH
MLLKQSFNLDLLKKLERKAINLTEIALERKILCGNGRCDYQKFLIICRKRTGSNFLVSLLQSHPKIRAFGEVFTDDERIYWGYPSYSSSEVVKLRHKEPIEFLDRFVFRDFLKSTKAVGFKLLYPEERTYDRNIICEYLRNIENLKVIHLKRRNILDNYVSHEIARKTDVWIVLQNNQNNNNIKLEINYKKCLDYFQKTKMLEQEYELLFAERSKQIQTVYYEDLIANNATAIEAVQKFLGVKCLPLISYTHQQEKRLLEQIIINYDELKEKFENTPWQSFFNK